MPIDTGARVKGRAVSRIGPAPRSQGRTPQARTLQRAARGATIMATATTAPKRAARYQQKQTHIANALARVRQAAASSNLKGLSPAEAAIAPLDIRIGHRYGIPPSVLMAQQRQESGFNPNAVSSANAFGVSQFIPSTAAEYGVKPGSSKQAVKSQVKGEAAYLTSLGFQKDPQKALSGYSGGYAAGAYNNPILQGSKDYKEVDRPGKKPNPKDLKTLQKAGVQAGGKGASPQHASASKRYTNPFPQKAWQQSRTDQGVDFAPKTANAPIRALGNATYVGKGEGPAWASGGGGGTGDGLLYKLHNSKGLPSPYIFTYEGVRADPHLKPGQTIKKGQIIGQGVQGGSLESGYADSSGTPISHDSYTEGAVTRGGTQFQNLLAKLPGSSATKGNIGSFISTGGGGSSGASGFASAAGVSVAQAKKMTPRERRMAIQKKLGQIRSLGTAASGTDIPTASLARSVASRSRTHGATLPHHSLGL